MFMLDMCPHHAPCGLCIKYDKPCNEVCGKGNRVKENKFTLADKIKTKEELLKD